MNNFIKEKLEYILNNKKYNCSYSDNYLNSKINSDIVEYYYDNLTKNRFMNLEERLNYSKNLNFQTEEKNIPFNQGIIDTVSWKDKILLKSPNDLIILNMLIWEIKPKSIIEFGSGNGSSSDYLNCILKCFNLNCNIYTFDILNKNNNDKNVQENHIDLNDISSLKEYENLFKKIKHPILIIEDAHTNYFNVIKYISNFCIKGDYLLIEDSGETEKYWGCSKQDSVKYLTNNNFLIDTKYTDFFGFNRTSFVNSILIKV